MLYKRSSFINLLKNKYDCELKTLRDGRTILVKNGPASAYIYLDSLDRIDYEEIYMYYKKLCLSDLPAASELLPIDNILTNNPKKKDKRK